MSAGGTGGVVRAGSLMRRALHGVATLEKPARSGYLRLGPLDRPARLETLIARLS